MSKSPFSKVRIRLIRGAVFIGLLGIGGLLSDVRGQSREPLRRLGQPGGDRLQIAAQFDRDRDGVLSKSERVEARRFVHERRRERLVEEIMRNDKNTDGKISREEMVGARRRRGPSFEDLDTNEDGNIDIHEAAEALYRSRAPIPGDFERAERVNPSAERDYGSGLYDEGVLRTLFLQFEDEDWLDEMHDFYRTDVPVPADLIVSGHRYRNVGVRYRGNSSFRSVPAELKRSIDIEVNHGDPDQRLLGYKTLNLLNAHDDPTFMREVLYSRIGRHYIPAFKGNFVKLVVNGVSWGIYPNIQQYNNDFLKEWFGSRGGVRWKGRGSLTFEGTEKGAYEGRYILKTDDASGKAWNGLIELCRLLKETPDESLVETLNPILNIDGALWSIALENVFVDEGYLIRGSDYNLFRDVNGRFHLLQHDGNEVLNRPGGPGIPRGMDATELPLYHESDNPGRPLVHRMLSNPVLRARYTAHVRTIIDEWLTWDRIAPVVEQYRSLIAAEVEKDVRKESSYEDFDRGDVHTVKGGRVLGIKEFVEKRRNFLLGHSELQAPTVSVTSIVVNEGTEQPVAGRTTPIKVSLGGGADVDSVGVYWATARHAPFQYVELRSEGSRPGDRVFESSLPAFPVNTQVYYYAEVRSGGESLVSVFEPRKAEAEPLTYVVRAAAPAESVVLINEVLAENRTAVEDPQGDYEDFIELYNTSDRSVSLSGMYLSDSRENPRKYAFPEGTKIAANGYLVVWADENGKAKKGLHANFKLSSKGEAVRLIDSDARGNRVLSEVVFADQKPDRSMARFPGVKGSFRSAVPTPGKKNF